MSTITRQAPADEPSMKHTILFLAANPLGTDHLALDREAHAIQAELERSGHRDHFELMTRWAVEPLDLLRELRKLRPTVVHFSGHGGRNAAGAQRSGQTRRDVVGDVDLHGDGPRGGLFFQAADGSAQLVSTAALRETFGAAGSSVKLVVLNTCYSESQAEALLAHVDCVVGMSGSIHDDAARSFAIGFYGGLGERESVATAYKQGRAAIWLEGLRDSDRPQLKVRDGIDADQLVLPRGPSVAPLSSPTRAGLIDITAEPHQRTLSTVQVDRLEAGRGGGVQVRVGGHRTRRRSTVKSTVGEPRFTGREAELRAIEGAIERRRVVVVHGAPGLGKSRLAREYAHQDVEAYPGGMYFIPFDHSPPTELARLLRDTGRPAYPDESVEDQCRRALRELGSAGRTLLIYDAIADEHTLRDWLPYDGLDWRLIVTSTSASWASAWSTVELGPLQPAAARELAASILGDDTAAERLAEPIAAKAAGITIELCASAAAVHERLCRGRTVERVSAELARETTSSFESAWTLLSPEARTVLQVASTFVTPRVPVSLIVPTLQRRGCGWDARAVEDAIDDARDRKLAGGDRENLDVHQLVAQFVRAREPLDASVRRSLFDGLLATARAFSEHPGDLDRRAMMLAYSFNVDDWAAFVADGSEWHVVGDAIGELGKFAEALPWFERAVAAAEKGDVHGYVDLASLATSLNEVGYCYASLGRFAEALPWFERAVAVVERGDVHGRVDAASLGMSLHEVGHCYASLGRFVEALPWFERAVATAEDCDTPERVDLASLGKSLHEVGHCYASLGRFAEALPWFERAVAAKEKGDIHGRVNPASLGKSLHQVGYCHSRLGKFAEALPWFAHAVAAKERGDVHGRVDPESLGKSLHQVGYCHWSLGEFAEALLWFERAVTAAEKGDVHGRVDPANLGGSLHQVGYCYSRQGKFADALPWFTRAVTEKEKGDVHGRVDHESLGRSVHQVGDCYWSQDKVAEALPWFERATTEKQKGDVHGHVDPESLGRSLQAVDDCHARLGKVDEARSWLERASRLQDAR